MQKEETACRSPENKDDSSITLCKKRRKERGERKLAKTGRKAGVEELGDVRAEVLGPK